MTIGTKLHQLVEGGFKDPLLDAMLRAPKFFIDRDVVRILNRKDVQSSVEAMIEAGIARLPFNPLLIEFKGVTNESIHYMVLFEEKDGAVKARCTICVDTDKGLMVRFTESYTGISFDNNNIIVNVKGDEHDGNAIAGAIMMALLMLNVRGIEKRVVETAALNKQRAKKGRPSIPSHTVVHIGTIYDRQGYAHKVGDGTRHMPVHFRAGHVRHQACGEGRQDRKLVYIAPILVNYRDGDSIPTPAKVVKL